MFGRFGSNTRKVAPTIEEDVATNEDDVATNEEDVTTNLFSTPNQLKQPINFEDLELELEPLPEDVDSDGVIIPGAMGTFGKPKNENNEKKSTLKLIPKDKSKYKPLPKDKAKYKPLPKDKAKYIPKKPPVTLEPLPEDKDADGVIIPGMHSGSNDKDAAAKA
jgi:hypothetical protein